MRQTPGQFRRQTTSIRPCSSAGAVSCEASYRSGMKQARDNSEVETDGTETGHTPRNDVAYNMDRHSAFGHCLGPPRVVCPPKRHPLPPNKRGAADSHGCQFLARSERGASAAGADLARRWSGWPGRGRSVSDVTASYALTRATAELTGDQAGFDAGRLLLQQALP